MALYLYGFIDHLPAHRKPVLVQDGDFRMDERFAIALLPLAGSNALVCEVDEDEFHDSHRPSPDWLAARACRHAGLLCALVRDCAVLPVKFGTLFSSSRQLRDAVDEAAIAAALARLRGLAEWSVKLIVDEPVAVSVLGERDALLRGRRAGLSSSPGVRYLQTRQLQTLTASALREHLQARTGLLQQSLQALAEAVVPLSSPVAEERGPRIACQFGVLLSWEREPQLQAGLEALARAWAEEGAWIELGGPWPAYDFCPALPARQGPDDTATACP